MWCRLIVGLFVFEVFYVFMLPYKKCLKFTLLPEGIHILPLVGSDEKPFLWWSLHNIVPGETALHLCLIAGRLIDRGRSLAPHLGSFRLFLSLNGHTTPFADNFLMSLVTSAERGVLRMACRTWTEFLKRIIK
ncbi:MAG: hypothetical protein BGO59_00595 [Spirosoma sp. 48-14]|nr:MAG: hypothetical protein BGO59_00595 [Spirosoma sp. 48-14]